MLPLHPGNITEECCFRNLIGDDDCLKPSLTEMKLEPADVEAGDIPHHGASTRKADKVCIQEHLLMNLLLLKIQILFIPLSFFLKLEFWFQGNFSRASFENSNFLFGSVSEIFQFLLISEWNCSFLNINVICSRYVPYLLRMSARSPGEPWIIFWNRSGRKYFALKNNFKTKLFQVHKLSTLDKLLLYLKLPTGRPAEASDPLRQPLNPLGSR